MNVVRLESGRQLGKIFVTNTVSCKRQKTDKSYNRRTIFLPHQFRAAAIMMLPGAQPFQPLLPPPSADGQSPSCSSTSARAAASLEPARRFLPMLPPQSLCVLFFSFSLLIKVLHTRPIPQCCVHQCAVPWPVKQHRAQVWEWVRASSSGIYQGFKEGGAAKADIK